MPASFAGRREVNKGGPVHTFDARCQDIVPHRRIIFSYDMQLDGTRISVSLTTIELEPAGTGTRLMFTEQGAFLDGHDSPAERERGTVELLDAVGRKWSTSARRPSGSPPTARAPRGGSRERGSNPRPELYKSPALPAELPRRTS